MFTLAQQGTTNIVLGISVMSRDWDAIYYCYSYNFWQDTVYGLFVFNAEQGIKILPVNSINLSQISTALVRALFKFKRTLLNKDIM